MLKLLHIFRKNVLPLHSNLHKQCNKYEKDCNFNGRSFGRYISFCWWFVDNN